MLHGVTDLPHQGIASPDIRGREHPDAHLPHWKHTNVCLAAALGYASRGRAEGPAGRGGPDPYRARGRDHPLPLREGGTAPQRRPQPTLTAAWLPGNGIAVRHRSVMPKARGIWVLAGSGVLVKVVFFA